MFRAHKKSKRLRLRIYLWQFATFPSQTMLSMCQTIELNYVPNDIHKNQMNLDTTETRFEGIIYLIWWVIRNMFLCFYCLPFSELQSSKCRFQTNSYNAFAVWMAFAHPKMEKKVRRLCTRVQTLFLNWAAGSVSNEATFIRGAHVMVDHMIRFR